MEKSIGAFSLKVHVGVSKNRGTPKSSILIGFSIINHPFWGTPIFGNTHVCWINNPATQLFFDEFASTHRIHVWYIYIYLHEWLIFVVNVCTYTIHGSYVHFRWWFQGLLIFSLKICGRWTHFDSMFLKWVAQSSHSYSVLICSNWCRVWRNSEPSTYPPWN